MNDSINYDNTIFHSDISSFFEKSSDLIKPVIANAGKLFQSIEEYLYSVPAIINLVKASIPTSSYMAVFTSDQLNKLAKGSIKLMSDKYGRLLANLVDTKTNKIISNVELREISFTPDLTQAMAGFAMQMQMIVINEKLNSIQETVDYIVQGQEDDRLATAYGCRERLIQALAMKDENNRKAALLNISGDAINSRNLLMQSQRQIINKIEKFKGSVLGFLSSGFISNTQKIDAEIKKLQTNLSATFGVSMVAAVAYEEINEMNASRNSVQAFADFLDNTYVQTGLIDKLDLIDPSPDCFWSNNLLPVIKQINKLPSCNSINYQLLEEIGNVSKCM